MTKMPVLGFALCALAAAAWPAGAAEMRFGQPAHEIAVAASPLRPLHSVLRYDAATAAPCRSFSDASSEFCLLVALHVIRLSEKSLPQGPGIP